MGTGVESCGYLEVGESVADLRIAVDAPEAGEHGVAKNGEAVGPEALGPVDVAEADSVDLGVGAGGGVGDGG